MKNLRRTNLPIRSLGYLDSDEQIALVYAAADLFVLPSVEDNLPNTMLEAMSCGTPVVGFRVGGLPDLVKDGQTGQLVPPGEAEQLGKAISALIFAPQQLAEMGQNCRHLIETDHTLTIQAQRYLDLYQELSATSPWTTLTNAPVEVLASFEVTLGPNFQTIYEPVLFEALQEYTPQLHQKWQEAEADRAAQGWKSFTNSRTDSMPAKPTGLPDWRSFNNSRPNSMPVKPTGLPGLKPLTIFSRKWWPVCQPPKAR